MAAQLLKLTFKLAFFPQQHFFAVQCPFCKTQTCKKSNINFFWCCWSMFIFEPLCQKVVYPCALLASSHHHPYGSIHFYRARKKEGNWIIDIPFRRIRSKIIFDAVVHSCVLFSMTSYDPKLYPGIVAWSREKDLLSCMHSVSFSTNDDSRRIKQ